MTTSPARPAPRPDAPAREVRRYDPDRRDRIIDACLDVIASAGVAGVSHRKVAEAADVPLGSMTYHFSGMHQLLHEAFSRFAEGASAEFTAQMAAATDLDSVRAAVTDAIVHHPIESPRHLVLLQELYTLAARDLRFRDITDRWMRQSREALTAHLDPVTARLLDALVEGLTLHRALDLDGSVDGDGAGTAHPEPYDAATVREAVDRITTPGDHRS